MKTKNFFIAIFIVGIGFSLYKLLLGFVLPIALFVSLGYVLKFLIKGSEANSGNELSQVLNNSDTNSSMENLVEIKPIIEDKDDEENKNFS